MLVGEYYNPGDPDNSNPLYNLSEMQSRNAQDDEWDQQIMKHSANRVYVYFQYIIFIIYNKSICVYINYVLHNHV